MTEKIRKRKRRLTLWLGGTSSLACTFVNEFGSSGLILVGVETTPPEWVKAKSIPYINFDLAHDRCIIKEGLLKRYPGITSIVIGVRPLLFAPHVKTDLPERMLKGVENFLCHACAVLEELHFILHISSVAAADHLQSQRFFSETDAFPPLSQYRAPYDIFKRRSEEEITEICEQYQIQCCHLRLSAIFSDESSCIQCSALDLQCRIGCYLSVAIDCNSSVNVSRAIDAILYRSESNRTTAIKTVYYYTRPLLLERPVPYGHYLKEFRRAYGLQYTSIWIPVWVVTWFVSIFHGLATWKVVTLLQLPYLDAADYLLQVASREHSFDCSRFGQDFPDLEEESILKCFKRRKSVLEGHRQSKHCIEVKKES